MRFWDILVWIKVQRIYSIICCVLFFTLCEESYAQGNTNYSYRKRVCKGEGCQQVKVRASVKRMNYPIGIRYKKAKSTSRSGYRRSICRGSGCYPIKYTVKQRDLNYNPGYKTRRAKRFSRYNPQEQRITFSLRDIGYSCTPKTKKFYSFRRYACREQPIQFKLKEYRYSCTPKTKKFYSFKRYSCHEQPIQFRLKEYRYSCAPKTKKFYSFKRYSCFQQPVQFRLKEYRYSCAPKTKRFYSFRRYSCYQQPIRFRLKEYSYSCYAKLQKARRFSRYTCYPITVPSNSCLLNQQECPIQFDKPTRWQVIKHDARNFFRNKHKHCKLMGRYTGVGKGNYITTSKGEAIVTNFKVKKNVDHPIKIVVRIVPQDLSKIKYGKHGKRKIKMKRKVIKKEETKRIMIREMTYRGRYDWILAAYPEESLKLVDFQAQYNGPPIPYNIAIDVQPPENKKEKKKKEKLKKKVAKEKSVKENVRKGQIVKYVSKLNMTKNVKNV